MATKIIKCKKCKQHKFQDKRYGTLKRVHNSAWQNKSRVWRCTVCNHEVQRDGEKDG